MPSISFKANVRFETLEPAGEHLLACLAMAAIKLKLDLTVTCGTDSHGPTDPHTRGRALDIRTIGLSDDTVVGLYSALSALAGPDFVVLYESPRAVTGPLEAISPARRLVNPKASAPHLHAQLRKGILSWPRPA